MTDNTNIEALPELSANRMAWEYPDDTFVYTENQMIEYGLLCRRAALSNAEPFAYLWKDHQYDNWEEISPNCAGEKGVVAVFLHPSVPAPGWLPIESVPINEDGSFLVLTRDTEGEPLAVQVSNFQGDMYPDHLCGCVDYDDRVIASAWMPLPLTNTGEQG